MDGFTLSYPEPDPAEEGLREALTSTGNGLLWVGAHGGSSNFVFADGHAEAVNSTIKLADLFKSEYRAGSFTLPTIYLYNQNYTKVSH